MEKDAVLKPQDKGQEVLHTVEQLMLIKKQIQQDIDNYNQQLASIKIRRRTEEEQISRQKAELDDYINKEKNKLTQEKVKFSNEMAALKDQAKNQLRSINEKNIELNGRELKVAGIEKERDSIFQQRIVLEKTLSDAEIAKRRAEALISESQGKINDAANKMHLADEKLKEAKILIEQANLRQSGLDKRETELNKVQENIDKVRDEIIPQIDELNKTKKENEEILKSIQSEKSAVLQKIEENKEIFNRLSLKHDELTKREKELSDWAYNLKNKELVLESKK